MLRTALPVTLLYSVVLCIQDGRLYLIVTRNGEIVRRMTVAGAGRLDDNQSHRVIITRENRRVSRSPVNLLVLFSTNQSVESIVDSKLRP